MKKWSLSSPLSSVVFLGCSRCGAVVVASCINENRSPPPLLVVAGLLKML
jgi:hypothetical protein